MSDNQTLFNKVVIAYLFAATVLTANLTYQLKVFRADTSHFSDVFVAKTIQHENTIINHAKWINELVQWPGEFYKTTVGKGVLAEQKKEAEKAKADKESVDALKKRIAELEKASGNPNPQASPSSPIDKSRSMMAR